MEKSTGFADEVNVVYGIKERFKNNDQVFWPIEWSQPLRRDKRLEECRSTEQVMGKRIKSYVLSMKQRCKEGSWIYESGIQGRG